jgi:hypothetical protein
MNRLEITGYLKEDPKIVTGIGADASGVVATAFLIYGKAGSLRLVAVGGLAETLSEFHPGEHLYFRGAIRNSGSEIELFVEEFKLCVVQGGKRGPSGTLVPERPRALILQQHKKGRWG